MGKDRVQREFNPPCISLAVDVVHLLQLTPGFVQGDVRVLSSQSLNMFELKRVMMYLYWLEEHNRQGLSLSLSVSTLLPRLPAQLPQAPLPPPCSAHTRVHRPFGFLFMCPASEVRGTFHTPPFAQRSGTAPHQFRPKNTKKQKSMRKSAASIRRSHLNTHLPLNK